MKSKGNGCCMCSALSGGIGQGASQVIVDKSV